ncbi:MAG: DUF4123 domain-containing protein [Rubrivivax sp.]
MSSIPPGSEPTTALTLPQWREALWGDRGQRVYAVLMGSRVSDLATRLAADEVEDWDLLWPGQLDAAARAAAPVVASLRPPAAGRPSPFVDWLLDAAAREFGGWGALVRSRGGFLPVRRQARALCQARLPDGASIRVDWMDPEMLDLLLPVAPADQLSQVFTVFDDVWSPGPQRWTRWTGTAGRIAQRHIGVAAAG